MSSVSAILASIGQEDDLVRGFDDDSDVDDVEDADTDTATEVLPAVPVSKLIASKRWHHFELHCVEELRRLAKAPLARSSTSELLKALKGARIHGPWCNVPAKLLVRIGYGDSRSRAERLRLLNAPAEMRGWSERGGDLLVECSNNQMIAVQCKDVASLAHVNNIHRFMQLAKRVEIYNATLDTANKTPSGLLQFPGDTKVNQMDILEWERLFRILTMSVATFSSPELRSPPRMPAAGERPDDEDYEDDVSAVASIVLDNAESAAAAAAAAAAKAAAEARLGDGEAEGDDDDDLHAIAQARQDRINLVNAARPKNATTRQFQTDTANKINNAAGVHLVRAPTGSGKTAIVALSIGFLMTKPRQTRRNAAELAEWQMPVMLLVAPYIDHARQLFLRIVDVLKAKFGDGWREHVEFVASEEVDEPFASRTVQTVLELKTSLKRGVRVFVATNRSSSLLLPVFERARKRGLTVHVVSDESHFESSERSSAMQLLKMVDASRNERGIAASATPDARVMAIPGLHRTLELDYDKAIREGFCSDYEIVLPLVHSLKDVELSVDVQTLLSQNANDALGAAALFTVNGMLVDGARRCVAYAHDSRDSARQAEKALQEACRAVGAACWTRVVIDDMTTEDRLRAREEFRDGADHEDGTMKDRYDYVVDASRPVLRFLIGVRILDQAIDLPTCDAVAIMTPPTTFSDVKSVHRAMQRGGRSLRAKKNDRKSYWYVFADRDHSSWLMALLDCLSEYDSGAYARLSVRSMDPTEVHANSKMAVAEASAVEDVRARYKVHSQKVKSALLSTQQRIDALVGNYPEVAPLANESMTIPADDDGQCEVVFPVGAFVDRIIDNWTTKKRMRTNENGEEVEDNTNVIVLTEEQKAECAALPWLEERAKARDDRRSDPTVNEKLEMLVAHFKDVPPKPREEKDVPFNEGSYHFRAGVFLDNVLPNFVVNNTAAMGYTRLTALQVEKSRLDLPWLEAKVAAREINRAKPTTDTKLYVLINKYKDVSPANAGISHSFEDDEVDEKLRCTFNIGNFAQSLVKSAVNGIDATKKSRLNAFTEAHHATAHAQLPWFTARVEQHKKTVQIPPKMFRIHMVTKHDPKLEMKAIDTVEVDYNDASYVFAIGSFVDQVLPNFIEGGKPNLNLNAAEKDECLKSWTGLTRRVEARKTRQAEPTVDEKIKWLIEKDPGLKKKHIDTVTVDHKDGKYVFHIGHFWKSIADNFTDGKPNTTLSDAQKKRCREGLDGLQSRVEECEATRAKKRAKVA